MKTLKYFPGFILLGCAFYLFVARGMHFVYTDSESMSPTIRAGDRMVVFRPGGGLPERGSIVNFRFRSNGAECYIKRVIGLPGDVVEIKNRKLYLNGEPAEEPYLYEERIIYKYGPATVPRDHLFVLGDNRNNSFDSTSWGFLPSADVTGVVAMVYWPYIGFLNHGEK
jgi:signal peptidase I